MLLAVDVLGGSGSVLASRNRRVDGSSFSFGQSVPRVLGGFQFYYYLKNTTYILLNITTLKIKQKLDVSRESPSSRGP